VFLTETPLRLVWFVPAQLFATVIIALFCAYPNRHNDTSEKGTDSSNIGHESSASARQGS
jgi:hypothetical protein